MDQLDSPNGFGYVLYSRVRTMGASFVAATICGVKSVYGLLCGISHSVERRSQVDINTKVLK